MKATSMYSSMHWQATMNYDGLHNLLGTDSLYSKQKWIVFLTEMKQAGKSGDCQSSFFWTVILYQYVMYQMLLQKHTDSFSNLSAMQMVHCLKQKHIQANIITISFFLLPQWVRRTFTGFEDCLKTLKNGILQCIVNIRVDAGEDESDGKNQ